MTNYALLVGINEYAQAPLRGCVNDVMDVAQFLEANGFQHHNIHLLLDTRARSADILAALKGLVAGLRAEDNAVFHFSGHGTQLPSESAAEVDGLDEVLCPVDYDWGRPETFIRDKQLRQVFSNIPAGANLTWIADCCHSGDLSRRLSATQVERYLPPPLDIEWRIANARARQFGPPNPNLALLTGCRSDQTSMDAVFDGRANGAMTYFLLKALASAGGLSRPLTDVLLDLRQGLATAGFVQVPQLEGAAERLSQGFLATWPQWQTVFAEVERKLKQDQGLADAFNARVAQLGQDLAARSGVAPTSAPAGAVSRGGVVARAFWWGFHIEIPRNDLQQFLSVANPVAAIIAAIGPVTGPAAPFIGLAAAFIAVSLGLLKGLDRGRGVYVSMSWFAPSIFVPTSV